jgi:hypothetical protein
VLYLSIRRTEPLGGQGPSKKRVDAVESFLDREPEREDFFLF